MLFSQSLGVLLMLEDITVMQRTCSHLHEDSELVIWEGSGVGSADSTFVTSSPVVQELQVLGPAWSSKA